MRNADDEFHARKAPLLNAISDERLQIARANHWPALVIELSNPFALTREVEYLLKVIAGERRRFGHCRRIR